MHIDSATTRRNGKAYTRHLLRTSYREGGKVKKRTIANLSHCSDAEINAIRLALQHKDDLASLGSPKDSIELQQGRSIGAVATIYQVAKRLGIVAALGSSQEGKLALWQVMARVIDQGSRLSAVRLAMHHAALEVIGLKQGFHEDHLYQNLTWLLDHQAAIEDRLFERMAKEKDQGAKPLFLYDVKQAFRVSKTGHLEIRPIYVRSEASTQGHVLVVMLAYKIIRELARCWRRFNLTVEEGIHQLTTLCVQTVTMKGAEVAVNTVPKPSAELAQLIAAAGVTMPRALAERTAQVVTRKSLAKAKI